MPKKSLPKTLLRRHKLTLKSSLPILLFALLSGLALILLSRAESNILGDVNGDSKVDITDLSIVLTNYAKAGSYSQGDLDSSGTVNVTDLSIVLSHYGKSDVRPTAPWPKYGVSTGYEIQHKTAAMQEWEADQIKAVGGQIVRIDYYNPTLADAATSSVLTQGLEAELIIGGSASAPGNGTSWFADLATKAATKWKGKVRFYEVLNEPDLHGWTSDTYTPNLKAAYTAIKAVDSNAIVWSAGMWDGNQSTTFMIDWVARMYVLGAKNYFDAFNFHCYGDNSQHGNWSIWDMAFGSGGRGFYDNRNIRSVMNANGDSNKPMVCTESGKLGGSNSGTGNEITNTMATVDGIGTGNRKLKIAFTYNMLEDGGGWGMLVPDTAGNIVAPDGSHWSKRINWTKYYDATH